MRFSTVVWACLVLASAALAAASATHTALVAHSTACVAEETTWVMTWLRSVATLAARSEAATFLEVSA